MAGLGGVQNLNADEQANERQRFFQEFIDQDYGQSEYKDQIRKMLAAGERRLVININHLRTYNADYTQGLLLHPTDYIPPFERALKDVALLLHNPARDGKISDTAKFHVGFEGSFGDNLLSPRNLSAAHLGKLICVEGIVTRCSLVRPKAERTIHWCPVTNVFHSKVHTEESFNGPIYPKADDAGNALETEFGWSTYRDYQTISLQEMPERAPAGQLPRPIDVVLDDDIVDVCKPGDRVRIVGIYRSTKRRSENSSAFWTVLEANNIRSLGKEIQQPLISDTDIQEIKKIAKKENAFDLLSSSLAPSVFGHNYIKKAILLLLLGGVEKNLPNGTHIRGQVQERARSDINMLMIGDPSTAKSQLLRFVLNIAPLAIATTGRGSSGVGLTAAVTTDKDTGERRLEAGAMVLADRGVVCIDEFDKMNESDRVAIHEVMEQQTVTIAKAGIHTSLNARCSVVAAANPAFGSYVDAKKPFENFALPESLLSRFDLLFVVLDNLSDEHNRLISEHVLRMHRYVPAGHEEGSPIPDVPFQLLSMDDDEPTRTRVYEKFNPLIHGALAAAPAGSRSRSRRGRTAGMPEIISIPFLKKYIHYAKTRVKPILTEEASDIISEAYADLRGRNEGEDNKYKTLPITPRTLETLIRLSSAHAKARLSNKVEEQDAEAAKELLQYALFKEVVEKKRKPKRRRTEGDAANEDSDGSDGGDPEHGGGGDDDAYRETKVKSKKSSGTSKEPAMKLGGGGIDIKVGPADKDDALPEDDIREEEPEDDEPEQPGNAMDIDEEEAAPAAEEEEQPPVVLDDQRYEMFKERLHLVRETCEREAARRGDDSASIMVHDIPDKINPGLPGSSQFVAPEVMAGIMRAFDENLIFYDSKNQNVIFM
ncbi:hypothetical protein SmJEL517_g01730 [Synchytrium microbalum]|uniref:DNA replication licensing factor MCM3 n=1 Tax=Synchytrium microbalum TaxID=1806994 RepID=A0A507CCT6_9FUNG|nr:uncharacterized protein SmJEL517_g01730 [Synchytrium microbalum]TPX35856.1 hypothetical protein SmJEL517_g01730 [Synchytrium microbalum]